MGISYGAILAVEIDQLNPSHWISKLAMINIGKKNKKLHFIPKTD